MVHTSVSDLDLNEVKLGKVGRNIRLLHQKEPLQIVTSKMYMPFGVKVYDNNYSSFSNCVIDCSLEKNDNCEMYEKEYDNLDKKITELIGDNKQLFMNAGELCYSPIFRDNKSYPKLIKINLPRDKNGNFECVIFDENKEKIKMTDKNIEEVLCKGKVFKGILECGKVYYYNGKYGSTWNLVQLRFVSKSNTMQSGVSIQNNCVDEALNYENSSMFID